MLAEPIDTAALPDRKSKQRITEYSTGPRREGLTGPLFSLVTRETPQ